MEAGGVLGPATVDVLVVLAALLVQSIGARLFGRAWVSAALFFLVVGTVTGPRFLGWFDLEIADQAIELLAALALATVLFGDAARADLGVLRRNAARPTRLLTVGLVGTVLLGALLAAPLFGELGAATLLILGTMLAPTDAALGQPVVTDPQVPVRDREVLSAESGLNDGIAVPILLLGLSWAGLAPLGETGPLDLLVRVLLVGALIGAALAAAAAVALRGARARMGVDASWTAVAPLVTALACFLVADGVGASGFISAFVGGVVFGVLAGRSEHGGIEVDEDVSLLLQGATWFVFGAVVVGPFLFDARVQWTWLAYAALSLTVVRMLPVALALLGLGLPWQSVAFIGWFGPRGLASIVFLVMYVDLEPPATALETVAGVVATTVTLSVLLHGLSAVPLVRRYGRWAARSAGTGKGRAGAAGPAGAVEGPRPVPASPPDPETAAPAPPRNPPTSGSGSPGMPHPDG